MVIGGVLGGILGSQVGRGPGRTAAIIAGTYILSRANAPRDRRTDADGFAAGDNPTDPRDPDTDGDGLWDGVEDASGDGARDGRMAPDLCRHTRINGLPRTRRNCAHIAQVLKAGLHQVRYWRHEEHWKSDPQDHQRHAYDQQEPPTTMALVEGSGRQWPGR